MKRIRVGIIGQGRSGRDIHAHSLAAVVPDLYEIVAVADPLPDRCDRAAKELGCRAYPDHRKLLACDDIDLVVNASPSRLHVPLTLEALEAGFNVLCEKPAARHAGDVDRMTAKARRKGRLLAVFQQARFSPSFLKVREVLDSGALGRIVEIRIWWGSFGRRWDWQTLQDHDGGSLLNTGPHPVDQALQLIGADAMPRVYCLMDRAVTWGDAEDHVKVILTRPGRTVVDLEVSSCSAFNPYTWQALGTQGGMTGTLEHLEWRWFDPALAPAQHLIVEPLPGPSYCTETLPWQTGSWDVPRGSLSQLDTMAKAFYENLHAALTGGAPLAVPMGDVRLQVAVIEECHRQVEISQEAHPMTSRERVLTALDHRQPDRVPIDLGASAVTGMQVGSVHKLRQALGLDGPATPVKVVEPYQMLGEIAPDLMDALGVDVVGLGKRETFFGFRNEGWKEWRLFDGTPVLVPAGFTTEPEPNGDILLYPEGDRSVPPSGRMPKGGWYFDSIVRQPPLDEARLDPADNLEEFLPVSDDDLAWFAAEARRLEATGRAVLANLGGTGFGDIALVPAPWLKSPKGIRDIEEWYVSTVSRREYVQRVFEQQCGIALANLERVHAAVGERVAAIFLTGADFGMQTGPFISPESYRDLYQPFHRALNDWVHAHTRWKTFIHSCGSVIRLLPDFIEAGFDILNPVQCSAAGMDPKLLKARYGDRVTFWGGGVDTQKTLPFGTPEDVRREVRERIAIFSPGGGFVFNTIHNVQAKVPVENLRALYEAARGG